MNKTIFTTELRNRGIYFFLTKYAALTGLCVIFITLFISDLSRGERLTFDFYFYITGAIVVVIIPCQVVYSYFFPHKVAIFSDRIVAVGPWKIKHTIHFESIQTVIYNERSTVIQKKFGINKIFIGKSIDPDREIQENLIKALKIFSH